jgi:hypothetical protein
VVTVASCASVSASRSSSTRVCRGESASRRRNAATSCSRKVICADCSLFSRAASRRGRSVLPSWIGTVLTPCGASSYHDPTCGCRVDQTLAASEPQQILRQVMRSDRRSCLGIKLDGPVTPVRPGLAVAGVVGRWFLGRDGGRSRESPYDRSSGGPGEPRALRRARFGSSTPTTTAR